MIELGVACRLIAAPGLLGLPPSLAPVLLSCPVLCGQKIFVSVGAFLFFFLWSILSVTRRGGEGRAGRGFGIPALQLKLNLCIHLVSFPPPRAKTHKRLAPRLPAPRQDVYACTMHQDAAPHANHGFTLDSAMN